MKNPRLTAVVVDDELYGRKNLISLLGKHCPKVDVIGTANGVESADKIIRTEVPDLVFLDIEMPGLNGFELLTDGDRDYAVIIVTAHQNYGIKAVKLNVLDYVLKPIRAMELKEAVNKVSTRNLDVEKSTHSSKNKMAIPHSRGTSVISLDRIVCLEADNMYTTLHLIDHTVLVASKPIVEFEKALANTSFFRIHKSHMINFDHLLLFSKQDGQQVVLSNNATLPVSRRRLAQFEQALCSHTLSLES